MVRTSTRLLLGLMAGVAVALGAEPATAAEPADLSVRVTSRSFRNGETGLFMVLVTNRGRNATDAPVHLDLDLPDGLTYVTGGGVGFDCSATASGVGCVRAAPFPSRTTVTVRVYVDVCTDERRLQADARVSYEADTRPTNDARRRRVGVRRGSCVPAPTATATPTGDAAVTVTPTAAGATPTAPAATTTATVAAATPTPTAVVAAAEADLRILFTTSTMRNGEVGRYTVSLTNTGPNATDQPVTVETALPSGFRWLGTSGGGFVCSQEGTVLRCVSDVPIAARSGVGLTIDVDVCADVSSVRTTMFVEYAGESRPSNNDRSRTTSVRSGSCQPTPTPTNTVPPTATATATETIVPATATPVDPNAPPTATPTSTATATATASATATATAIPDATDLSLVKLRDGTFTVGATGRYEIIVTNNGPAATNVPFAVVDTLPAGLTFAAASGTDWSCAADGATVTCDFGGVVAALESTSFTLTVDVAAAAFPSVTNEATVAYPSDTDPTNDTGRRPTTVRQ